MSDEYWKIDASQNIFASFKQLARTADAQGRGREFLKSAKWIESELKRTPLEFGEARYSQPSGRFLYRVATVRPIFVEYIVDPANHVVYYRQFKLLKETP